jgi:hypothetical protein
MTAPWARHALEIARGSGARTPSRERHKMDRRFVLLATTAAAAATANADLTYTTVEAPIYPGELNHAQILGNIFGGAFGANGLDYTNGAIDVMRVADDGADGIIDLLEGASSDAEDQFWGDSFGVSLRLEAKYAADSAILGWKDGTSGGVFNPLIETGNLGDSIFVSLTDEFRWALNDTTTGVFVTSNPNDQMLNDAPVDQMVAYHVTGVGEPGNTWVIFFEDRIGGDYDFNDAVFQLTVVPSPGGVALLAMGGLVLIRRRR